MSKRYEMCYFNLKLFFSQYNVYILRPTLRCPLHSGTFTTTTTKAPLFYLAIMPPKKNAVAKRKGKAPPPPRAPKKAKEAVENPKSPSVHKPAEPTLPPPAPSPRQKDKEVPSADAGRSIARAIPDDQLQRIIESGVRVQKGESHIKHVMVIPNASFDMSIIKHVLIPFSSATDEGKSIKRWLQEEQFLHGYKYAMSRSELIRKRYENIRSVAFKDMRHCLALKHTNPDLRQMGTGHTKDRAQLNLLTDSVLSAGLGS
jgi:hypothetical protein